MIITSSVVNGGVALRPSRGCRCPPFPEGHHPCGLAGWGLSLPCSSRLLLSVYPDSCRCNSWRTGGWLELSCWPGPHSLMSQQTNLGRALCILEKAILPTCASSGVCSAGKLRAWAVYRGQALAQHPVRAHWPSPGCRAPWPQD